MKIESIKIENFRSIKKETIIFPESGILALVGPNNAGKSNILRAIYNILGESFFNKDKAEKNDFYLKQKENSIRIEINFDNNWKVKFDSARDWPTYEDENNTSIKPWGNKPVTSTGSVKDDFPCTYLPANRSLEKNLQFKSYELMGKIAKKFNEKAGDKKEIIEQKFDEIMSIFDQVDGFNNFKADFVSYFNDMQSDTPYKLKVDFKAFSPLNYFKTLNILANDSSVNEEYDVDIEELGEGNKSLVLFALIRSYAKNFKKDAEGILAIEEPEIYLHPQARKHLFCMFKEIVKDSNIQIIYTTHSSDFISTEDFDSVGLTRKEAAKGTQIKIVTKEDLVSFCTDTGVLVEKTTVDNIAEFYTTTSNIRLNEAFFAKKLILVEGETEEICLPFLLDYSGLKCNSQGISVVAVGGKNQIPKYWRLFKCFGIETYVLFDNDNSAGKKESNINIAKCFNCTIDDILNDVDIIKILIARGETALEQKIFILESDFETSLKKDFLSFYDGVAGVEENFKSFQEEAVSLIKPTGNTQKAQISRFVIRKIFETYPDYKPSFIEVIKEHSGLNNNITESGDLVTVDDIPL